MTLRARIGINASGRAVARSVVAVAAALLVIGRGGIIAGRAAEIKVATVARIFCAGNQEGRVA